MTIIDDFRVRVRETLYKAATAPEGVIDFITLSILGGRMSFPNGTAEFVSGTYPHLPEAGERYVLFLKRVPDASPVRFLLVYGAQSAFRVAADKILPAARPNYPIFGRFLGTAHGEFRYDIETEIRALSRERRPR